MPLLQQEKEGQIQNKEQNKQTRSGRTTLSKRDKNESGDDEGKTKEGGRERESTREERRSKSNAALMLLHVEIVPRSFVSNAQVEHECKAVNT